MCVASGSLLMAYNRSSGDLLKSLCRLSGGLQTVNYRTSGSLLMAFWLWSKDSGAEDVWKSFDSILLSRGFQLSAGL